MAQELSQLNHYFSQTRGTWTQLQTVDLLALGDDTTRNILKGWSGLKELVVLYHDCVELNRPAALLLLIRERIDLLRNTYSLVLPASLRV